MIDFDVIKVDNFYAIKVSLKLMGFGCPKTEEGEGRRTENDRVKGLEKKTKRKEQEQKTNKRK